MEGATTGSTTARAHALRIFEAAVAGALPGPATALALRRPDVATALREASRVHVIALGKAAPAMAAAAVDVLASSGAALAGGLVVSTEEAPAPHPSLDAIVGDHPLPGEASLRAARALGELADALPADDLALVLLSGGTSSLVGAPVAGIADDDHRALCVLLLGSGLDIAAMNAVRKRFSRWGAGRLAAALAPARALCLAVSDVIGDDPAAIGSGPCVPDPLRARDVRRLLGDAGLDARLPASCAAYLDAVERGEAEETPKPEDAALARAETRVVVSVARVLDAPASLARQLGYEVRARDEPIAGDTAACGRALGAELRALAAEAGGRPTCVLWRGETTVRLTGSEPPGGRCQELALAAAEALRGAAAPVTLLAAGTDGRDGPTDAAGACVDERTWDAVREAGRDPSAALAAHASHAALERVDALVRTGPTGTNVGDVVIALVGAPSPRGPAH